MECGSYDLCGRVSGTNSRCGFFCRKFNSVGVGFGVPPSAEETLLLAPWKMALPNFLWIKMQNSHMLLQHYVCLYAYHVSSYEENVLNF